MNQRKNQYLDGINVNAALYLAPVLSVVALAVMEYDPVYKVSVLLPVCYFVMLLIFVRNKPVKSIGLFFLLAVYAFRMCVLTVICAYGNFSIAVDPNLYIQYFTHAVVLMCFENVLVFSFYFLFAKMLKRGGKQKAASMGRTKRHTILKLFGFCMVIAVAVMLLLQPSLISRFHVLMRNEAVLSGLKLLGEEQALGGPMHYLLILIEMFAKPVVVFLLIDACLKRENKVGIFLALLLTVLNIFIVSDRRILSVLVGGVCMMEILYHLKTKISRKIVYTLLAIFVLVTVCYAFYGENSAPRIARKFQVYFSGVSLTAFGFRILNEFKQGPSVFLNLLFNDSILLTGLFGRAELANYFDQIIPGLSFWTPPMIGSLQYFGLIGPLLYLPVVFYYAKMECLSQAATDGTTRMMYNYLLFSMSIYFVAYQMNHLYYYMISFGLLYNLLIFLDRKCKVAVSYAKSHAKMQTCGFCK